ncbi:Response regulator [Ignavibacterium album JCM 16511]|uniref:Response regulator n=1 Tax=Ignavibacterium album (strain DSM 19864 / JCM 16511 / NBRC 101810 / Mat9-16) TaxID=945713 RepID=I0AID8_IGNAJ|nr:response regulator [Ignavibacterium album]AFH48745.1 Response regulator [Ignavibacterium album JCM 16511]
MSESKKKIFYAEDSDSLIKLMTYKLQNEGYEIIVFNNGEEVFERALAEKPNLIILDLMMPIKDGFTVLKEIKSHTETSSIPVIMLTTNAEEDTILKALEAGASEYITKPFSTAVLLAKIKKIIG